MVVTLISPAADPNVHRASRECVPCGRPGCNHCQHLHVDHDDACRDTSCACQEFSLGEDCTTCGGDSTVEEHHWAIGTRDVACPNDDCVDGKVR